MASSLTILQLLQWAADELGIKRPSTVVASTDSTTRQLLALLRREGLALRDRYSWPVLQKEHTFTLANGTASYALPGDYLRLLDGTLWDRSQNFPLIGGVSPRHWQYRKSGISQLSPRMEFRIKGTSLTQFYLHPTPDSSTDGNTLAFEYITTRWIKPVVWTASTSFAAGAYCFYDGNYYITTAGGTTGSTEPTHTSSSASDGGVSWEYYSSDYESPTADTDTAVLDSDLLVMGIKWRFMQQKGLEWEPLYRQYDDLCRVRVSAYTGASVLSLTGPKQFRLIDSSNIPDNGYG